MKTVLRTLKNFRCLNQSIAKNVSRMASGSTYDGKMITNEYLKGNYFQRQDNLDILKEFKDKLNWTTVKILK